MSRRFPLKILDEILLEVEAATSFTVIPVLVDDLLSRMDLLASALRDAGGDLIYAEDAASGVDPAVDAPFEAVVTDQLSRATRRSISYDHTAKGLTRALVDGQDAASAAYTSAPTVLGVATALFARGLREVSVAAIAYDEDPLDADAKQALWDILTVHLPKHGKFGSARALVVFVGASSPDYPRHCRWDLSARYRVAGGTPSRRNRSLLDHHLVDHLELERRPYFTLFLGAGFSASSRLPLGNALRDEALAFAVGKDGQTDPTVLVARFMDVVVAQGRSLQGEIFGDPASYLETLTLERVLREERNEFLPDEMPTLRRFADLNAQAVLGPGPAIRTLRRIIDDPRVRGRLMIATVNFDELLEDPSLDLKIFATESDFGGAAAYLSSYSATDPVPYFKFHGTIANRDSIIANVDDTTPGLEPNRAAALDALTSLPMTMVYVGYSMRDLDLGPLLGQRHVALGLDERWVSPFLDSNVEAFAGRYRARHWSEQRLSQISDRVITQTADQFLHRLAEAWAVP